MPEPTPTPTPGTTAPGPRRRSTAAIATIATALAVTTAACTSPPAGPPPACAGDPPRLDTTATCSDQTPPRGTNGIVLHNGRLVIADLNGGQILVVDPATGVIRARYGPAQGVSTGPDDLTLTDDGTIYWTGPSTGVVGRISPDGIGTVVANIGPGANGITLLPDGQLLVGRFLQGRGLVRIDPRRGSVTNISSTLWVNAFALGPDGLLYAPDTLRGRLLAVDPVHGTSRSVATRLGLVTAARLSADGRTAFVLSALPAAIHLVDLTHGRSTPMTARLTTLADNLAVAPGNHLYVTAFNQPKVTDVGPNGASRTIAIGHR